jgi:histone H3/H4
MSTATATSRKSKEKVSAAAAAVVEPAAQPVVPPAVPLKKPRAAPTFSVNTRAVRAMRREWKTQDDIISRRRMRRIAGKRAADKRFSEQAIAALVTAAELHVAAHFRAANIMRRARGRTICMRADFRKAQHIFRTMRDDRFASLKFAKAGLP